MNVSTGIVVVTTHVHSIGAASRVPTIVWWTD
jgi:hypothetical protein